MPAASQRRFWRRTRLGVGAQAWLVKLTNFGLVGAVAFVVDVGIYNLLRSTILDDKPIGAKVVSVAVATLVAWIGHRRYTFRAERGRPIVREALLFGVMNLIGLLIAAACLFVSHYLLGFTSQLADNIAGNGVGLVLGMAFRFLAYQFIVFRTVPEGAVSRRKILRRSTFRPMDGPVHPAALNRVTLAARPRSRTPA